MACITKQRIGNQTYLYESISFRDTIKGYGSFYLFNAISEKIGLTKVLSTTLPSYWKEIFALAFYLISSDKPLMHCDD